jgi:glycosyltransferase involved in cell wall biosynthesis
LTSIATWRLQTSVIAVSQEVADSIRRNVGESVPVRVIRNGVDCRRFVRDATDGASTRGGLGIPSDAVVVGSVAVFRTQKRLDRWIEVAAHVQSRFPQTHFVLVGDGPERPTVEAAIREHRAESFVHLCGLREDVRPVISAMDVYLMTSIFEGLPVALLEAMSMQTPVVATSVGGIPEVVREGVEGHLAAPDDFGALVEAVGALVRDPATRHRMAEQARLRVMEGFGMARMQSEIESVYGSVLSGKGA